MIRFFVSPEELELDFLVLTGENAAHAKVLRIKNGEDVLVCDGEGKECICTVSDASPDQISLVVTSRRESTTEPRVKATVYMAFPKADKLEHVIQKSTELGVHRIVAFPTSRCISRPDKKSLEKKLDRWQKIAESAAKQSGRGFIPEVCVLESYEDALRTASESDVAILFYENERANTLRKTLQEKSYSSVSIVTGPEGGLTTEEVQQAIDAGLSVCTLGNRILRCETAPLCALSAIMYDSGEF